MILNNLKYLNMTSFVIHNYVNEVLSLSLGKIAVNAGIFVKKNYYYLYYSLSESFLDAF